MDLFPIIMSVFAAIIGLVIGYVSVSAKMKSSKEAAKIGVFLFFYINIKNF